ncbi:Transporter [Operophtera brumata]|uniref:Transporter n=1 Tax=Operophtera brumata TaxID=104452 RepID=A0A0L7KWH0_OPEBR|nr:Transporter [Operophtera brumata]
MQWGSQIEFLMSCIATSVGLGNVWRFPFVAYQNGGGAFLIPYIIVLFLVGKPMYYLECILGQFSSKNSVRALGCGYILSYYVVIVALCLYYLSMSFQSTLPWAVCDPEWLNCVPSDASLAPEIPKENATSSAELYFLNTVLQQSDGIEGGLGLPIWYLVLCLLAAWAIIFLIVAQGVKSSGKAAYFLAVFPYIVMIILLITTRTVYISALCCTVGFGIGLIYVTPVITIQRGYPGLVPQDAHCLHLRALLHRRLRHRTHLRHTCNLLFNAVILDSFPRTRTVYISALCCTVGFGIGLIYVTPGGQYILELVDYYGGTFLVLFAAIAELFGTSVYWRMCWGFITPVMMLVVFIYALISFEALTAKISFRAKETWGPRAPSDKRAWQAFKAEAKSERQLMKTSRAKHIWLVLTGGYRKRN